MAHFDVSKIYETLKEHFNFFMGLETFSIVSCPTRDTSPRDFSVMTLHRVLKNLSNITVQGLGHGSGYGGLVVFHLLKVMCYSHFGNHNGVPNEPISIE